MAKVKHNSSSRHADDVVVVHTRDAILGSARHLTPTQMGYVMNRMRPGHDYTGCNKGSMAQTLAELWCCGSDMWRHQREPSKPERLHERLVVFRIERNHNREARPLPGDFTYLANEIAKIQVKLVKVQKMRAANVRFCGLDNVWSLKRKMADLKDLAQQAQQ